MLSSEAAGTVLVLWAGLALACLTARLQFCRHEVKQVVGLLVEFPQERPCWGAGGLSR